MSKSSRNIRNNKLINISELAKEIGGNSKKKSNISTHTLRFWESKFSQIKPIFVSGRRYYTRKDVEVISLIKFLLKDQGLTIAGAKKVLNKKINTLDDYRTSSITSDYYKAKIKTKTKILLNKIKSLKK